ncbi:thioredoxin 1 [Candidatus Thermokryptus mobilis]|uniref:Thioredoxin 1 n=1 Tax=Candidatus Thermokryptus mobilis TaxID=1643428 RepID=A0A0S4MX13_9BACT|nr:thioredoxin family protein [Candidatus Thermokryptus mobilis]CUU03504.1 thioredoxin 1 [Candidatus Thermokryptus mobilis]
MLLLYFILALIVFVLVMNFSVVLRARFKKGKSVRDIGGEIGEAIKRGEKVMLYFYSPTCSACRVQTPIIDSLINLSNGRTRIFKVDVSSDPNTALKFGVMGTPSIVIVENGKIKEFFVGVKSENILRRYI